VDSTGRRGLKLHYIERTFQIANLIESESVSDQNCFAGRIDLYLRHSFGAGLSNYTFGTDGFL